MWHAASTSILKYFEMIRYTAYSVHVAFHTPPSHCLPWVLFSAQVGELDSNKILVVTSNCRNENCKYSCSTLNHETVEIFNCKVFNHENFLFYGIHCMYTKAQASHHTNIHVHEFLTIKTNIQSIIKPDTSIEFKMLQCMRGYGKLKLRQ